MKHHFIRNQVVRLCVELSKKGYFAGTGGNIALRVDPELVAVTPSATDYLTMLPEDVCIVRLNDLQLVEGTRAPSVETSLHAKVLQKRPDVLCSIHTHQPIASALALMCEGLDVSYAFHSLLGPRIPVVGYAPSGSSWLANRLAKAVRPDVNAYLMKNHGVLCCGRSVESSMNAVSTVEQIARTHILSCIGERTTKNNRSAHALQHASDLLRSEIIQ